MATNTKKTPAHNAEKFIKVKASDHTRIKIQAATEEKTMGEYVADLARKDKSVGR